MAAGSLFYRSGFFSRSPFFPVHSPAPTVFCSLFLKFSSAALSKKKCRYQVRIPEAETISKKGLLHGPFSLENPKKVQNALFKGLQSLN